MIEPVYKSIQWKTTFKRITPTVGKLIGSMQLKSFIAWINRAAANKKIKNYQAIGMQFQPFLDTVRSPTDNKTTISNNNSLSIDNNHELSSANCSSKNRTPIPTTTAIASIAPPSPFTTTATKTFDKMYPYVSNHPSSHSGLSGMPGFSSLEDKTCR